MTPDLALHLNHRLFHNRWSLCLRWVNFKLSLVGQFYIADDSISSAPAIRLFQKWKHAKSASYLIIDEPGKTPFHQRLINFPLLIVFSTFGFIGFISISNHIFASEEVHVEEFVVKAIGKRRVRYDLFEYILISNGDYATSLNLGETPKTTYSVGDKLEVTLKTGLWGYYIVEDVVNGG